MALINRRQGQSLHHIADVQRTDTFQIKIDPKVGWVYCQEAGYPQRSWQVWQFVKLLIIARSVKLHQAHKPTNIASIKLLHTVIVDPCHDLPYYQRHSSRAVAVHDSLSWKHILREVNHPVPHLKDSDASKKVIKRSWHIMNPTSVVISRQLAALIEHPHIDAFASFSFRRTEQRNDMHRCVVSAPRRCKPTVSPWVHGRNCLRNVGSRAHLHSNEIAIIRCDVPKHLAVSGPLSDWLKVHENVYLYPTPATCTDPQNWLEWL